MRARIVIVIVVAAAAAAVLGSALAPRMGSCWAASAIAAGASSILGVALLLVSTGRALAQAETVRRGLGRLIERDWGARVPVVPDAHAGDLAVRFNTLAELLRSEQETLEQRELLLRTVIDAAPMAILLLDSPGRILYSNETARELFFEGRELEGHNFLAMLGEAPAPFREAVLSNEDALFAVDAGEEPEMYHLAKRHFELQGEEHVLVMVKHMTRELRRQEVDIWKKLIRVISHELNNSLAPITSLVHTARMLTTGDKEPRLERVFGTIEERARHLQEFVEGYARFARLPKPRRERVNLEEFLARIRELVPFAKVSGAAAIRGHFDKTQVEQVIINLLKNAQEAGSPEGTIELTVTQGDKRELRIAVADRGTGMSPEVLQSALLPFYSTKERGTGLGLALSREIVEAHGGRLRLENREGGGLLVSCTLPGPEELSAPARAKLTLSRL